MASNDQDHADGNVKSCSIDASGEAIGDGSNVICLNAPNAPHGVVQVAIHSSPLGCTGVVNAHSADLAMNYCLLLQGSAWP
jgi:hypothetical protein